VLCAFIDTSGGGTHAIHASLGENTGDPLITHGTDAAHMLFHVVNDLITAASVG
jgi:hypothetical protein